MQVSGCAVSGLLDHLLLSREEHMLQGQERGRGTLGGVRSVHNVTALMNTLPAHMQRWGLSHFLGCCHLTACSDNVILVHSNYS